MSKKHKYVTTDNAAAWVSRLATIGILLLIATMQMWILFHL